MNIEKSKSAVVLIEFQRQPCFQMRLPCNMLPPFKSELFHYKPPAQTPHIGSTNYTQPVSLRQRQVQYNTYYKFSCSANRSDIDRHDLAIVRVKLNSNDPMLRCFLQGSGERCRRAPQSQPCWAGPIHAHGQHTPGPGVNRWRQVRRYPASPGPHIRG